MHPAVTRIESRPINYLLSFHFCTNSHTALLPLHNHFGLCFTVSVDKSISYKVFNNQTPSDILLLI